MVKRPSENTRWIVLSLVIPYLPNRTQARFSAINKEIKKKIPCIKAPTYASIIEDFTFAAKYRDFDQAFSLTYSPFGSITLSCDYLDCNKLTFHITFEEYKYKILVTKCHLFRLKSMIYRAISSRKIKYKSINCSLIFLFENLDNDEHKKTFTQLI